MSGSYFSPHKSKERNKISLSNIIFMTTLSIFPQVFITEMQKKKKSIKLLLFRILPSMQCLILFVNVKCLQSFNDLARLIKLLTPKIITGNRFWIAVYESSAISVSLPLTNLHNASLWSSLAAENNVYNPRQN